MYQRQDSLPYPIMRARVSEVFKEYPTGISESNHEISYSPMARYGIGQREIYRIRFPSFIRMGERESEYA